MHEPPRAQSFRCPEHSTDASDSSLIARIEIVVLTGDEGRKLHALQADAVYGVLTWLAHHSRADAATRENDT
jgi:hypothetical protein